jgi:hypothetical protein
MALVNVKYRLHCTEHERGWGSKPCHYDYDTRAEAENAKREINEANNLPTVPDYYETAGNITIIEVEND